MDDVQRLILQARQKRDKAIAKARREYARTYKELRSIGRRLGMTRRQQQCYAIKENDSLAGMTVVGAAEAVLRERPALTLPELAIEIQRRGCRSEDDSRRVLNVIRNAFRYHSERFSRDYRGRWSVVG
jgi:flagellar biosynthesis/type III secretory pathway protein FliH